MVGMFALPVEAARIAVTTTIPPIPTTPQGVQLQCQPLQAFPGSVTSGSTGFIIIRCPTSAAIQLGPGFLTPSFTLALGFDNISITRPGSGGQPCDFNFGSNFIGNVSVMSGGFLNRGYDFENPPTNSTQLLATTYDYCIHYTNAPAPGIGFNGFTVVWS